MLDFLEPGPGFSIVHQDSVGVKVPLMADGEFGYRVSRASDQQDGAGEDDAIMKIAPAAGRRPMGFDFGHGKPIAQGR